MGISQKMSIVSNDAFQEIFQSMSEGIIMVDESGKVLVANPVAEQLFGYISSEMNGMQMEMLLPERYRKGHVGFRAAFNAHPEPRRMGLGRDLTALRRNGTEFPVEISLSYTRLKGHIVVMAFISDISQRKKAEDDLKRSEEQLIVYAAELEEKVRHRTQALNEIVLRLEREVAERKRAEEDAKKSLERERELNELKSKFVSIASHEFRTPLSAVMSSAALINQYNEKGDTEKVDKHVKRIKASVNHLTAILNDFLSLGKLEEGRVEVSRTSIDLREFFEEIQEEVSPSLKEGQQLNIECPGDIRTLDTDPRIMRNILFNLISNASKYSDKEKNIYITCTHNNGQIIFSIRDEGIGISKEDQRHLFDRFFRASNAGNIPGTGLGLNIVKRYVELLRGDISFTSEHGKGSTFIITLPLENSIQNFQS
ncbi:MAG TPA: PAS domain-containing sensor histidine kinase [Cyclobacteriaceae bacterium]|nr:PAS domain-containing sensor histidine kinase [Cyclobacteriaceae bacterium]